MKKLTEKSKYILLLLALVLITVIGATVAYYTSQRDFENKLSVKEPGVTVIEKFNPSDQWVPGEEKEKEVWFTNTGEIEMLLRFHVKTKWADGTKTEVKTAVADSEILTEKIVVLNQNDNFETNFTEVKSENAGSEQTYYYYNKVLKPGEQTTRVLDSVTFSSALSNDAHGVDYSGSQVNIEIIGETVLASVDENGNALAAEQWGMKATIEEENDTASGKTVKNVTWEKK